MNLNKHLSFLNPSEVKEKISVIGVGAVGSTIVELLARLGFKEITIYDFDTVEDINIANQMFFNKHIGMAKVDAVEEIAKLINPDINIIKYNEGWFDTMPLTGYVFMCVDSIKVRKDIVQKNRFNPGIKAFFDFRMRLTDAQHYASDNKVGNLKRLLATMDFTDDEAKEATPTSACGTSLSVVPTVRDVVNAGVCNFINYVLKGEYKHTVLLQPFEYDSEVY